MYYAREYLKTSIVIDGDQLIKNTNIIKTEIDKSGYACYYVPNETNEWLLTLDEDKVVSCSRTGGENGYELKGLSYWTNTDSDKLRRLVKEEYESGKTNIYWDDVALFERKGEIELYGYKINKGDIVEIDSLDELKIMDEKYKNIGEENV